MKLPRPLLPLFILALCARTLLPAAEVEIQQHWTAGKRYFQTVATEQQSTIDLGPQKMQQSTTMTMEMSMTVRAHEDGQQKRLTLKYERIAMEMDMNGQRMSFDSAKPSEGTDPLGMAKTVGIVVGQELKLILNAQDEVVAVENYEEFLAQIAPATSALFNPREIYSQDSLREMVTQAALVAVPGQPVAPGAVWEYATERTMPQLGQTTLRGTYTFKNTADHGGVACAEITTQGTITTDPDAPGAGEKNPALAALGMKITDGTVAGTIWFDPALGMARESQLVQEMNIWMKNPADPGATLVVPMKQNITTTLTRVEAVK
jgi:hypothetical protein